MRHKSLTAPVIRNYNSRSRSIVPAMMIAGARTERAYARAPPL